MSAATCRNSGGERDALEPDRLCAVVAALGLDEHNRMLAAGAEAWREPTPKLLRSVCACDHLTRKGEP